MASMNDFVHFFSVRSGPNLQLLQTGLAPIDFLLPMPPSSPDLHSLKVWLTECTTASHEGISHSGAELLVCMYVHKDIKYFASNW